MAEQLLRAGGRGNEGFLITREEEAILWEGLEGDRALGYMGDVLEKRLQPVTAKHVIIHSMSEAETWEQTVAFFTQYARFEINPITANLIEEILEDMIEAHCKKWGHWNERWFNGYELPYRKSNAEGKKFGVWMRLEAEAIEFIGEGAEHINKNADLSIDENIDSLFKFLNNSKPYPTLFSPNYTEGMRLWQQGSQL